MTALLDGADAPDPRTECGHIVIAGSGPVNGWQAVLRCTLAAGHLPAREHADAGLHPSDPTRWRCSPGCSGVESHYLDGEVGATGELIP